MTRAKGAMAKSNCLFKNDAINRNNLLLLEMMDDTPPTHLNEIEI
jgi:hypothetical protein